MVSRQLTQNRSIGVDWSSPFAVGRLPLSVLWGAVAIFLVSFANLISLFDDDADTTTSLDLQSLLKLLFVGLLGLYAFQRTWCQPGMLRMMFALPGFLLTSIACWLMLTSLISSSPTVSLASALSSGACIWGAMGGVLQFGPARVLRLCGIACLAFLVGSWGLWLIDRDAATFLEPIDNGQFVARFGGFSHPNAIGQYSGLTLVLGCLLFAPAASSTRTRWFVLGMLFFGGLSLLACASRTSILATLASLGFAYRESLLRGRSLLLLLLLATIGLGTLVAVSTQPVWGEKLNDKLLKTISKSGNTEELASGTGRSKIWAESIRLIGQRPLTGYGAATSKDLLADYTRYTHNMLLNVGLSGGVVPMLLLSMAFLYGFSRVWVQPNKLLDALFLFLFVNGLAENVCFLVLDSAPMVIFTTVLVCRSVPRFAEWNPNRLGRSDPEGGELS